MTAVNDRCATGIEGLDLILQGGLPRHRLYLVQGDPGVGKTTLALQFLLEGAKQGESGLYITLSETKDELVGVAESHGWSLEGLHLFELSSIEERLSPEAQTTLLHPSEVELNQTTQLILDEVKKTNPVRVVFDSLSELRLLAQNPLRYRRQLLALKQFFAKRKCTVLLLDDRTSDAGDLQVQSLAHGVIALEQVRPEFGAERRRLSILKIRGSKFVGGFHDYVILSGGLDVFPRLVAAEHRHDAQHELVSCGIPEIDSLLGGGMHRGTSNLLIGPAGSGKSTLALQYALAAAKRGERTLYFAFDESPATMETRAKGIGLGLAEGIKSGCLKLQQIDPAEMTPGEFAHRICRQVENEKARVVVIDSLNGFMHAMPDERFLMTQLHELLAYLGQHGVLTIMVLAQHGLVGRMESSVDLTYLADTVVLLRYFEAAGKVKKAISVIKKRSGAHEDTIREYAILEGGAKVGQPLTDFQGVLSGTPVFAGRDEQILRGADDQRSS